MLSEEQTFSLDEDWGCVPTQELFCPTLGRTRSLAELVENIQAAGDGPLVLPTSPPEFPLCRPLSGVADQVHVVTSGAAVKPPSPSAPKILKKRKAGSPTTPSLKRVTFEVEKLLADEGDDKERTVVRERIAIGLGAKQRKGEAMNYKRLKEERARAKALQPVNDSLKLAGPHGVDTSGKISKKSKKLNKKKAKNRK